jgi:hypothetical protein
VLGSDPMKAMEIASNWIRLIERYMFRVGHVWHVCVHLSLNQSNPIFHAISTAFKDKQQNSACVLDDKN